MLMSIDLLISMDQQVVGLIWKLYSECFNSDCLIDLYQDWKSVIYIFLNIVVIRSNQRFYLVSESW